MAVSSKVLGIVWNETSRLRSSDGLNEARLQAVVGAIAGRAESGGSIANFSDPGSLPAADSAAGAILARMTPVVENAIATGRQGGLPLPKRAALWEVAETGQPRETERPLPLAAAWVKAGSATNTNTFAMDGDGNGRLFSLFESDVEPTAGEPSFVSGLTGSGLSTAKTQSQSLKLPWALGIFAAFLFFWMQLSLAWTGQSISQAKNLMSGTIPASSDIYFRKIYDGCKSVGALVCEDPFLGTSPPAADLAASATAACVAPVKAGESSPLHTSAFCQFAWSLAVSAASTGEISEIPRSFTTYVSAFLGWPVAVSARTGAMSLAFPMAGVIVSIAILCIALGLGTRGQVFGIWISQQNRISLARMQVTLWTIVVLGAYASVALFNAGMLAESIRSAQASGAQALLETLTTFPSMPSMILAALGISVVSPMLSAIIKGDAGAKAGDATVDLAADSQAKDASGIGRFIDQVKGDGSNLEVRESPADASLADLFLGETESSKDIVDPSRLQNVIITFILVFGYGTLLFQWVREISPEMIVNVYNSGQSLFSSLPNPGGVFTTLLAASHGVYLVAKATAK